MKTKTTFIDVGKIDISRPANRPPKTNWKMDLVKKSMLALQLVSPKVTSELVWSQFTRPGKTKFTEKQQILLEKANVNKMSYLGYDIATYRWGDQGPKVLLSHGWRSKIADFRVMIESFVAQGFVVEGIDMKAHGNSEGKHTALPEMRDILKNFYVQNGPYHTVIGYSIGGLCAGVTLGELSKEILPKHLFIIAAPPYTRYFFFDTIKEVGLSNKVYEEMCLLVNKNYHQDIDYFDMRKNVAHFSDLDVHLIYDEQDQMIPFQRGLEMREAFSGSNFVHTKGLGHYKIISHPEIVGYVIDKMKG